MPVSRRNLLKTAAVSSVFRPGLGRAQEKAAIRIGVLTDLSGTYRDNTGPTSVACCRQAVEEFAESNGLTVEVLSADHQNKPDVAASIARQWFDQGVDAIADVPTSSVALAVSQIAREKDKILLDASAAALPLSSLSAVSYRAVGREEEPQQLQVWPAPLALAQPLPTLPLWIAPDFSVPLDLEASYQMTCADLRIRQAG